MPCLMMMMSRAATGASQESLSFLHMAAIPSGADCPDRSVFWSVKSLLTCFTIINLSTLVPLQPHTQTCWLCFVLRKPAPCWVRELSAPSYLQPCTASTANDVRVSVKEQSGFIKSALFLRGWGSWMRTRVAHFRIIASDPSCLGDVTMIAPWDAVWAAQLWNPTHSRHSLEQLRNE